MAGLSTNASLPPTLKEFMGAFASAAKDIKSEMKTIENKAKNAARQGKDLSSEERAYFHSLQDKYVELKAQEKQQKISQKKIKEDMLKSGGSLHSKALSERENDSTGAGALFGSILTNYGVPRLISSSGLFEYSGVAAKYSVKNLNKLANYIQKSWEPGRQLYRNMYEQGMSSIAINERLEGLYYRKNKLPSSVEVGGEWFNVQKAGFAKMFKSEYGTGGRHRLVNQNVKNPYGVTAGYTFDFISYKVLKNSVKTIEGLSKAASFIGGVASTYGLFIGVGAGAATYIGSQYDRSLRAQSKSKLKHATNFLAMTKNSSYGSAYSMDYMEKMIDLSGGRTHARSVEAGNPLQVLSTLMGVGNSADTQAREDRIRSLQIKGSEFRRQYGYGAMAERHSWLKTSEYENFRKRMIYGTAADLDGFGYTGLVTLNNIQQIANLGWYGIKQIFTFGSYAKTKTDDFLMDKQEKTMNTKKEKEQAIKERNATDTKLRQNTMQAGLYFSAMEQKIWIDGMAWAAF